MGECGCDTDKVPDGNGDCVLAEQWVPWIQPTLTSNTSYGTLTASAAQGADATSCTSSNHPAFCAFDGQIGPANTKWYHGSSSSGYLIWHLPVQLKVSAVQFYTTNETGYLNRFPSSITVYGSNNGSSWTPIGSLSGYSKPGSSGSQTVSCDADETYEYLKFGFTNTKNELAISEIKITAKVRKN